MATYVSDTFTGTNGTLLSAHTPNIGGAWTANSGLTIQGNELQCGLFVSNTIAYNATLAGSDDCDTSMDIVMSAASAAVDFLGVTARGNAALGNNYTAYYNAN